MTDKIERPSFCTDEQIKFLDDLYVLGVNPAFARPIISDRFHLSFNHARMIFDYWKDTLITKSKTMRSTL